ncbi:hypothetical protein Sjap_008842 [Stephania japonica]|uniref:F-box domain-containing protein n=1 Tax=Stephania japonica TaxID=461633 RepID=A0AAP0PB92_9MAGN
MGKSHWMNRFMEKKKKMKKVEQRTEEIPVELLEEILLRLPAKSLVQLTTVSKAWQSLIINDSIFINRHLINRAVQPNNYSLVISNRDQNKILFTIDEPRPAKLSSSSTIMYPDEGWNYMVMGSCDGLLLLVPDKVGFLRIWNPCTRDFMDVPPPHSVDNRVLVYGFGRDLNRNEYKVVAIIEVVGIVQVKTFSASSSSWEWRTIENLNASDFFNRGHFFDGDGKFVSGAAHWLGFYSVYNNTTQEYEMEWRMIAFDFKREELREILLPQFATKASLFHRLSVWKESIYVFILNECVPFSSDLYVMKEYGVRDSWCKLYTIPETLVTNMFRLWSIVCFTDNGQILLQENHQNNLAIYDPKSGLAVLDDDDYLNMVSALITAVSTFINRLLNRPSQYTNYSLVISDKQHLYVIDELTTSSSSFAVKCHEDWNFKSTERKASTIPENLETSHMFQNWRIVCFMDNGKILLQGSWNDIALDDPKHGLAKLDNDEYRESVSDKDCIFACIKGEQLLISNLLDDSSILVLGTYSSHSFLA